MRLIVITNIRLSRSFFKNIPVPKILFVILEIDARYLYAKILLIENTIRYRAPVL